MSLTDHIPHSRSLILWQQIMPFSISLAVDCHGLLLAKRKPTFNAMQYIRIYQKRLMLGHITFYLVPLLLILLILLLLTHLLRVCPEFENIPETTHVWCLI